MFENELMVTKGETEWRSVSQEFGINIHILLYIVLTSLVAQMVKHLPTMWETQVQSLGWEDPLEKAMTTHSSTLAWKIPWTEEPVGYSPWGRKELDMIE